MQFLQQIVVYRARIQIWYPLKHTTAGRGHFELLKFPLTRLNGQFILFPTLISKHWQKEKKVPAMRLYLPSNLPISGLKFIEKQIF